MLTFEGLYVYYCRMRPPGPGAVPAAGLIDCEIFYERQYVAAADCMAWGIVVYNRPLTPQEVAEYELRSLPREVEP